MSERVEYRVVCEDGSDPDAEVYEYLDNAEADLASFDQGDCSACSGPHRVQRRAVMVTDWEDFDRLAAEPLGEQE